MFLLIMNNNSFKNIDTEKKIPAHVKSALIAEIETIRNTAVLVELFVGNFINTFSKSIEDIHIKEKNPNV